MTLRPEVKGSGSCQENISSAEGAFGEFARAVNIALSKLRRHDPRLYDIILLKNPPVTYIFMKRLRVHEHKVFHITLTHTFGAKRSSSDGRSGRDEGTDSCEKCRGR